MNSLKITPRFFAVETSSMLLVPRVIDKDKSTFLFLGRNRTALVLGTFMLREFAKLHEFKDFSTLFAFVSSLGIVFSEKYRLISSA